MNLTLSLAGGTTWELRADVTAPVLVGDIALKASSSLGSFTAQSPVCPPAICILTNPLPPPGFNLLHLVPPPGLPLLVGPSGPTLLGSFAASTGSAAEVQLLGGEAEFGYAVRDFEGGPLDYSISIVPEPAAAALVLVGCALLVLRRNGI